MKHGLVRNESYKGYQLLVPPSRLLYNKIGLPIHETYRFIGYKSSILRHLIDSGDTVVNGKNDLGFTIQLKIGDVMKSATDEIVDTVRGVALGAAGSVVSAVDIMNTVLDGVSVLELVRNLLPESEKPPELKRPSKARYLKDHALNSRIIVDISMHKGEKVGWIDTEASESTLKNVAYAVNAA